MIEKSRFFDIFGKNMGFDLIFAKIHIDHQILRKKLGIFKKKKLFFSLRNDRFQVKTKFLVDRKFSSFFNFIPQNIAFSLIFAKNQTHHQILRKKWAEIKKKSRFFR